LAITKQFLEKFKRTTEERWESKHIDDAIYGFQIVPGTRWNPGLSEEEIAQYADALSVQFPDDFRTFLCIMNGTNIPTLNVYGRSNEPTRTGIGAYSYPRDIDFVKHLVGKVGEAAEELRVTMAEDGFDLPEDCGFVPIYGHRYLLCTSDSRRSVVLSIAMPSDAIVYGETLEEYLIREFL
jgi:hypothetical protein